MWHHAVLAHFVGAQLTSLGEFPRAQVALEWLLISVNAHVALEVLAAAKPLEANDAAERLLSVAVLCARVSRQRIGLAEALAAHLALVGHAQVLLEVRRQVPLVNEPLATEVAAEFGRQMHLQVAAQVAAAAVCAAAHVAHERPLPPASTSLQSASRSLRFQPSAALLSSLGLFMCTPWHCYRIKTQHIQ